MSSNRSSLKRERLSPTERASTSGRNKRFVSRNDSPLEVIEIDDSSSSASSDCIIIESDEETPNDKSKDASAAVENEVPATDDKEAPAEAAQQEDDAETSSSSSSGVSSPLPKSTTASTLSEAIDLSPFSVNSSQHDDNQLLEEQVHQETFYPNIPDFVLKQKSFKHSIRCPGCGSIFACQRYSSCRVPSLNYFIHCFNCRQYSCLNRTVSCKDCCSRFLNKQLFDHHIEKKMCLLLAERNRLKHNAKTIIDDSPFYFKLLDKVHKVASDKPADISISEKGETSKIQTVNEDTIVSSSSSENQKSQLSKMSIWKPKLDPHVKYERSQIQCEGCKEEFDCFLDSKRGRLYGFNEFYRHCIFQCAKYQKKQKIKFCMKCNNLFINKLEYVEHQCSSDQHAPPK